jgi:hypothetical protein
MFDDLHASQMVKHTARPAAPGDIGRSTGDAAVRQVRCGTFPTSRSISGISYRGVEADIGIGDDPFRLQWPLTTQSTRLICPSGCFPISLSIAVRKNISFRGSVETAFSMSHPASTRGAYRDRHGRWVRDAVDVMAAQRKHFARTSGADADGEVVWS